MTRPGRELRRRSRLTAPGSDLSQATTARQGQTARDTSRAPDRSPPPGMEPPGRCRRWVQQRVPLACLPRRSDRRRDQTGRARRCRRRQPWQTWRLPSTKTTGRSPASPTAPAPARAATASHATAADPATARRTTRCVRCRPQVHLDPNDADRRLFGGHRSLHGPVLRAAPGWHQAHYRTHLAEQAAEPACPLSAAPLNHVLWPRVCGVPLAGQAQRRPALEILRRDY